jgi:hypothetical protein
MTEKVPQQFIASNISDNIGNNKEQLLQLRSYVEHDVSVLLLLSTFLSGCVYFHLITET